MRVNENVLKESCLLEEWRDILGFEGLYQVSNFGQVQALDRIVICKDGKLKHLKGSLLCRAFTKGYAKVALSKNGGHYNRTVHRLVAEAFLSKIDGKDYINHIDGIRDNNKVENLEWCTVFENNHSRRTEVLKQEATLSYTTQITAVNIKTGETFKFNKMLDAARFLGEKSSGSICGFFRGDRAHVKGYVFERSGDTKEETIKTYQEIIERCQQKLKDLKAA